MMKRLVMNEVTVVFCTAKGWDWKTKILHKIIGSTVEAITDSDFAHAAIIVDNKTYEMLEPGLVETNGRVYTESNTESLEEITIQFTDEQIEKLRWLLNQWESSNVGYALLTGCVAAGVAKYFPSIGNHIDDYWSDLFNTMMCSEMVTNCIRIKYPDFLQEYESGSVYPELCRVALKERIKNEC